MCISYSTLALSSQLMDRPALPATRFAGIQQCLRQVAYERLCGTAYARKCRKKCHTCSTRESLPAADVSGGYIRDIDRLPWTWDDEYAEGAIQLLAPSSDSTILPTLITRLPEHLAPSVVDNAIILVDKPLEWTGVDTVRALAAAFRQRKIGYVGTLDPQATGLLIVAMGKATKETSAFSDLSKEYTGVIVLGQATESYDASGKVVETLPWEHITNDQVQAVAARFQGDISLTPPMWSAVRYKGKPLWKYAEKGFVLDIPPKPFHVQRLSLTLQPGTPQIRFQMVISNGTYVRSIAHELGQALGTCSHLQSMRRVAVGEFRVEDAWTLDVLLPLVRQYSRSRKIGRAHV